MSVYLYITPVLAVCALLFAAYKAAFVSRAEAGNERMREIAAAIAEGADAFLKAEYRILVVFIAALFLLIGLFIGENAWLTAVCFLLGAGFSILAGFFGMKVATRANVRTAQAASEGGMNRALAVAFSGGSVMGMCVVGLGLLGCSLIYLVTGSYSILHAAGAEGITDWGRGAQVTLPKDSPTMKKSLFCRDCRALLSANEAEGYVLLDLHDREQMQAFALTDGAEYTIRDYTVSVFHDDANDRLTIFIYGTI